ncbi:ATP-binding protein [Bradyrhizobium sp. PMVTL-01]|uniref:ATP-binding protein n=1 Tax=Bradyrhizobium sp. PMVTL-01 TaxID=3434999 RepID=UPI003F6FE774
MSGRGLAKCSSTAQPANTGGVSLRVKQRGRAAKTPARNLITERKYVSILRADLHRSSDLVAELGVEESIARLAPALEQMRAAVHQQNGIIHREMGDGLFAVFGAPIADDLHAVMACLAALDLLSRIEALGDPGIRVRVGVHSGLVVAGPRQLDYTRSYDFDGPPLIMAERLQAAAAPNQALASEICRTLAAGYVQFGIGQTHVLKGFPQPVTVHPIEAIGELSKWRVHLARGSTAFVGRTVEFSRILSLADAAAANRAGTFVVVTGEPGIGKSRLAHETMDALRGRGWQSIDVECSPILGHSPYSLLKNLLGDVVAGLQEADMAALRAELSAAQMAGLEVVLHGPPEKSNSVWAGLTPRARGRAIVAMACAVMLRKVDQRPTLLLIEDLQWADEASAPAIEAITALTERLPLVILTTARNEGVPAWVEGRLPVLLPLAPLNHAAGMAMLDQILGLSPRLNRLKTRILNHTGAMPLFIEEVCRGLAETHKLTGSWGAFEPASVDAGLDVPLTVQGVIASRIDRLSPIEKRLLQVAAAIGPEVPSRLLQTVSALQQAAFGKALSALVAAGMLVALPEVTATNVFPHECVRQVAYDAVLGSDKTALHGQILAELETQLGHEQGRSDLMAAVVHHALQAREWSRAADNAAIIARQCLAQSALPDATRYFAIAIEAIDHLPVSPEREARAVDLRIESRLAYANLGQLTRWLELAKEAEARAGAAGDRTRQVSALAVRAAALNFCGPPTEAVETSETAVREAARSGEAGWLGYAEYGLGQARYVAGQYSKAVEALTRAYERFTIGGASAPPGGSSSHLALLSSMMTCIIEAARGDLNAAAAAQDRVESIAAQVGGTLSEIAAGFSRGVLLLCNGELEAAETTLARASQLAHQHDVNLFVPVLGWQHGLALLRIGRREDARHAFETAKEEAAKLGHRSAELRAEMGLALCDATSLAGRSAALERVRRCEQTVQQLGYEPIRLEALHIEAALRQAMNDEGWRPTRMAAERIANQLGAEGLQREIVHVLARTILPTIDASRMRGDI